MTQMTLRLPRQYDMISDYPCVGVCVFFLWLDTGTFI